LQKVFVDGPRFRSEFGMKRGSEEILVLYKDGFASIFRRGTSRELPARSMMGPRMKTISIGPD